MQNVVMELASLLRAINAKKDLIMKTQKEVEIKIAELDKLLDKIQTIKSISPPENQEAKTVKLNQEK